MDNNMTATEGWSHKPVYNFKDSNLSHKVPEIIEGQCLAHSAAIDRFCCFPELGTANTEIKIPSAQTQSYQM